MRFSLFIILFSFSGFVPQFAVCQSTGTENVTKYYKTVEIKEIQASNVGVLTLEIASNQKQGFLVPVQRAQLRDEDGHIVAFTPARLTTIPFCVSKDMCWIFMWKTIYPLPAIFKFNSNPYSWVRIEDPPIEYSRGGVETNWYAGGGIYRNYKSVSRAAWGGFVVPEILLVFCNCDFSFDYPVPSDFEISRHSETS